MLQVLEFCGQLSQMEIHNKCPVFIMEWTATTNIGGSQWCSWLRHCATSWKVVGSIPDDIKIFHWLNPSERTVAPGVDSASNRNDNQEYFLGVKASGA